MPHDVFISHASSDKSTADAVCHALEDSGIRCWIAPRDVQPGEDWKPAIVSAVEDADVVVLVFSGEANRSSQVHAEIDLAFEQGHPIVPLRIEDREMDARLKYCVGSRHWLDALSGPLEDKIDELVDSVYDLLRNSSRGSGRAGSRTAGDGGAGADDKECRGTQNSRQAGQQDREQIDRFFSERAIQPLESKLENSKDDAAVATVKAALRARPADEQDLVLWLAVREGAKELVDAMLSAGADPNTPIPDDYDRRYYSRGEGVPMGTVPLFPAVTEESGQIVKSLLEAGADPTKDGLLHVAVTAGTPESLRHLLEAGVDPDDWHPDYGDSSPLVLAAALDDPEFSRLLLNAGADPGGLYPGAASERVPLHSAVESGRIETVELLLEAGADPDRQYESPNFERFGCGTPLHYAVYEDREDAARMLLENGADPNVKNALGETPRDIADRWSSMDKLLKEYGGERSGLF